VAGDHLLDGVRVGGVDAGDGQPGLGCEARRAAGHRSDLVPGRQGLLDELTAGGTARSEDGDTHDITLRGLGCRVALTLPSHPPDIQR
jgi:hypothetical protein